MTINGATVGLTYQPTDDYVVAAVLWNGRNTNEVMSWIYELGGVPMNDGTYIEIQNGRDTTCVLPGEFVVYDIDGMFVPMNGNTFRLKYKEAENV